MPCSDAVSHDALDDASGELLESPGVNDDSPQSAEEEELLSDWFCISVGLVSPGQVLSEPEAVNLCHC